MERAFGAVSLLPQAGGNHPHDRYCWTICTSLVHNLMGKLGLEGVLRRVSLSMAAGAGLLASMGVASAGDLAPPAPYPYAGPPPLPVYWTWTGLYVGGNVGGAWASGTLTDSFTGANISETKNGFIGGGQIGFNYQMGSFVVGAEWQFDGASLNDFDRWRGARSGRGQHPLADHRVSPSWRRSQQLAAVRQGGWRVGQHDRNVDQRCHRSLGLGFKHEQCLARRGRSGIRLPPALVRPTGI